MNQSLKNRVILFSGPNFLALTFLEYAISKNFTVNICSKNLTDWKKSSNHIAQKNRFTLSSELDIDFLSKANYILCFNGFDKEINKFKILSETKTLVITPFEKYDQYSKVIPQGDNIAAIYLGDVIGPRINLSSSLLINQVLNEVINKNKITLPVGELFYPIFTFDVIKEIFNFMFSFGPYGKEVLLLGEQTFPSSIWQISKNIYPNLILNYDTHKIDRKLPSGIEKKTIFSDLRSSLKETYGWLSISDGSKNRYISTKTKTLVKPQNSIYKFSKIAISTFLLLIFLPFILFGVASAFYYSAYKNFNFNKLAITTPILIVSRESAKLMSPFPMIGKYYKEVVFMSEIGILGDKAFGAISPVAKTLNNLANRILGNQIYDIGDVLLNTDNSIKQVYVLIEDLENLINKQEYMSLYSRNEIVKFLDFPKIKLLVGEFQNIIINIPNILGGTKTKTYLLLFQNNMELRPTGGFIGSYGLLKFEKGRLVDITVSDVYSADGQLKGHVEPPSPIREYLGEAGWYLRDSNWDPDFPVSARRAEWFLDKEIGVMVDGVIAIDLSPVKDILAVTGPIFLSDYNMDITSENLYEKTQQEVESNFFAGSRKKASFLTSLSRNLLNRFSDSEQGERVLILKEIFNNLEKRHIQIYLHDNKSQLSIEKLNWDGSVKTPTCKDECFGDIAGVVEANLGVNKVNQFITREIGFETLIDEKYIYRKLKVLIKNSANVSLGPSGRYRVHIRVIRNSEAEIDKDGQFVEILPNSSELVEFNWKSEIPPNFDINKYKFYFRKQAGVTDFPFSLTVMGKNLYNGQLDRDLFVNYEK